MTVDDVQRTEPALEAGGRCGEALLSALLVLAAVASAGFFASLLPSIASGEAYRIAWPWVPTLNVSLSFYLDGLSLLFALLVSVIGALVFLYTGAYASGHRHFARLHGYLALFTVAMLGLVLADNLITLYVFWELTTVASYLLIGFEHDDAKARAAALQALLVTTVAGLAMLVGLLLLGIAGGTFEMSELRAVDQTVREHALYGPVLGLVLCGAFAKSAQVPFHFWLPNAMAAPTPISAYLHSATMVKAGIYLLARLHPVLGGTDAWLLALGTVGAVTAVLGSVLALRETDLKRILAYSTLMGLGTLTMFLGGEAKVAVAAAMTFLLVHALYKSALFLVVGIVDHAAGARDLTQVRGLVRVMPVTAFAAGVAALSMAGFPPFLGFIGKELQYEGALAVADAPALIVLAAVAANAMMVAVAGLVSLRVFLGPLRTDAKEPHEAPIRMWLGPVLLASLGLILGMSPGLTESALVQPAVMAVLREPVIVELELWHGINLSLMLSVLTLVLGVAIYAWHARILRTLARLQARLPLGAEGFYERGLDGLNRFANAQTAVLQNGSLRCYLAVVIATFVLGVAGTLLLKGGLVAPPLRTPPPPQDWAVLGLIAAGTLVTLLTGSRLTAVCALGVVSAGVGLLFLLYGAPDVAMAQLLTDTLFIVLATFVLLRLPGFDRLHFRRRQKLLHASLALSAGATTTALLLGVIAGPFDRRVTDFFEAHSHAGAHGRNIVNIILVDFRVLDTLGEATVVVIAALAAYALLKQRLAPEDRS